MPKEYNRTERVGDLIQKELMLILQKEIADPRLRFITITAAKVSKDFSFADILFTQYTSFQTSLQKKQALQLTTKLLNKASSRLRYALAQRLKLRITPQLRFYYDDLFEKKQQLQILIDQSIAMKKNIE